MTARSLRRSLARWSLRSPTVRRGLVLMHVVLVSCCGLAFGRESAFCPGRRTAGRDPAETLQNDVFFEYFDIKNMKLDDIVF